MQLAYGDVFYLDFLVKFAPHIFDFELHILYFPPLILSNFHLLVQLLLHLLEIFNRFLLLFDNLLELGDLKLAFMVHLLVLLAQIVLLDEALL